MAWHAKGRFEVSMMVLLCSAALIGFTGRQSLGAVSRFGDLFPAHEFSALLSAEDQTYLGLSEGESFNLADVQADLIVLELLNIYCTSCQMQAPIYNDVFRTIDKDPTMRHKVKWLAVGVGNNPTEVKAFRKMKEIPFPIVPDAHFDLYDAIGGPGGIRTPFTLLVRRDQEGRAIVIDSHMGLRQETEEIVEGIKAALQYDLAYVRMREGERLVLPAGKKLEPPLSDDDLLRKVKEGMTISGGVVEELRRITPDDEFLYMGRVRLATGDKQLFAKVVSRPPVCDICHDIHFIYVFDGDGMIVNFIPIHLTKYGNRKWSEEDIQTMKDRLIGRSILTPFHFDRDVDAVSRATITSVVIFYSLERGRGIYDQLPKAESIQ